MNGQCNICNIDLDSIEEKVNKFRGQITAAALKFNKKAELLKWMAKNAGLWFEITIKVLGKSKDRKTREQLGFYWGLLLPEIHDEYIRQGMTVSVAVPKVKINGQSMMVDRKPTMDDSHELNKDICGLVGTDEVRLDVRDMDKYQIRAFIDNILDHAVQNLLMNGELLKARRPAA